MKALVEGNDEVGYISTRAPDPALLAALAHSMAPLRPSRPEAFATGEPRPLPTSVGSHAEGLLETGRHQGGHSHLAREATGVR